MEAAATPFPREETTPPVTKINFDPIRECYARGSGNRANYFSLRQSAYSGILRRRRQRVNSSRGPAACVTFENAVKRAFGRNGWPGNMP